MRVRAAVAGCLTLLIAAGIARAQSAADSDTLRGRTLLFAGVSYSGQKFPTQTGRSVGTSGFASFVVRPFVTDHWQLGLSPTYYTSSVMASTYHSVQWSALADYGRVIPFGLRAFVGVNVLGYAGTNSMPGHLIGWHAGVMRFVVPQAAVRVEFRDYDWFHVRALPFRQLVVTLDQYMVPGAGPVTRFPGWGTTDVAFIAGLSGNARSITASVAPFLTPFLQVGGSIDAVLDEGGPGAHAYDGTVRLYAPLSPRFMPFVGGTIESTTWNGDAGGFSDYSGSVGARHALQPGLSLDGGLALNVHRPLPGFTFRSPNELSVFAKVVLSVGMR